MAAASTSRRWATGSLDVGSNSSDSDSDSDSEDGSAPPMAVTLLSLPTAGGLRARRDSGPVQLPAAGGGSDSDDDDDFGESVVPLVMPTRCPSRRDSRRCGFGHEISTATAHKVENVTAMRNEAEAERLQRRRAEQMAQEEAERKAKVQEEGICVSEIVSLFSTTRPQVVDAANPTLSPAGAPVASDDKLQAEEEPSPPWSDGDVADRAEDEAEGASDTEDSIFGLRGGGGRRRSVVQFPGWSSKTAVASSTSESADSESKECAAAPGSARTSAADALSVQDLEADVEEQAEVAQQRSRDATACANAPGGAEMPAAGSRSVQDVGAQLEVAAAEVQDAQQQRLAKMMATAQPPTAGETSSPSLHDEATAARQALATGADWAENAWDEEGEMEFVDEIRARQIEQLVRSGRMPISAPSRPNVVRPTSRGFHSTAAAGASKPASAMAIDGSIMPRPPPKRSGSPAHNGRRPAPPPKAAGPQSGRVMSGRTVRGRTVAATAAAPAAPVCV